MVLRIEKDEALLALEKHREEIGAHAGTCVMCLLSRGAASPGPIHQTDEAVVLLDRFGSRKGHLMVVSKEHVEDVLELGSARYLRLQELAFDAVRALERAFNPTRVFVASLGAPQALPMSFPHFHIHIIPIYESDERSRPARVFSWTDGVVVYDEEQAAEVASQVREVWPRPAPPLRAVAGGL